MIARLFVAFTVPVIMYSRRIAVPGSALLDIPSNESDEGLNYLFPRKDAFKNWRKSNGSGPLYSFTTQDTRDDPCRTDCNLCPESDSAGFQKQNLAEGDWPCLCHAGYRGALKAGDYNTVFTHEDLPYEFLLAGALGQTTGVKEASYDFLVRVIRFVRRFQIPNGKWACQEERKFNVPECDMMAKNEARAVTVGVIEKFYRKIDYHDHDLTTLPRMLRASDISIDLVFSVIYSLLPEVYKVFNTIMARSTTTTAASATAPRRGKTTTTTTTAWNQSGAFERLVHARLFELKKDYIDFFCKESQSKKGPCDFEVDVQMNKKLHHDFDFSMPFDGWFEWRFISKRDGSGPPQKGPFTPGFKENLPIKSRARTTLNVYKAIGLPFTDNNGELEKLRALLDKEYGKGKWTEDSVLPISNGITWWEQFDCDCSVETCQPSAESQICEGGFSRVAGRLGGRSVAGPSGTTQKMMLVARLLLMEQKDLYLLRASLISWMVPSEDHSLLEILMGAEDSGVPYYHDSRVYSLRALLPLDSLSTVLAEAATKLETLHKNFNLDQRMNVEDGPRSLCGV